MPKQSLLHQSDAVEQLLIAARKIVSQAERATDIEAEWLACSEARDAITQAIATRNGEGEVFAHQSTCPCSDPVGGSPCRPSVPCPYAQDMPAWRWGDQSKLTDDQCAEIATWARRIAALGSPPRVIVDHGMTPGQPIRDCEAERLYVHPEDYLALQRWDDRHGQLWV